MGRASEHVTHTLVFDESNDKLYFHIGSGCDICREDDPERATVIQMNTDGTGRRIYASGLRNAIGLDLHPVTGELWAANSGHNAEGKNLPPEWITPLRDGGFYGWPFAYADKVWTDFSIRRYRNLIFPLTSADSLLVANMDSPAVLIPAHLAPMALHFYEHDQFPPSTNTLRLSPAAPELMATIPATRSWRSLPSRMGPTLASPIFSPASGSTPTRIPSGI